MRFLVESLLRSVFYYLLDLLTDQLGQRLFILLIYTVLVDEAGGYRGGVGVYLSLYLFACPSNVHTDLEGLLIVGLLDLPSLYWRDSLPSLVELRLDTRLLTAEYRRCLSELRTGTPCFAQIWLESVLFAVLL